MIGGLTSTNSDSEAKRLVFAPSYSCRVLSLQNFANTLTFGAGRTIVRASYEGLNSYEPLRPRTLTKLQPFSYFQPKGCPGVVSVNRAVWSHI